MFLYIYLPVNTQTSLNSIGAFEKKLKMNLAETISRNGKLNSDLVYRLYNDLQNDNQMLDDIREIMKRNIVTTSTSENRFGGSSNGTDLSGGYSKPINSSLILFLFFNKVIQC